VPLRLLLELARLPEDRRWRERPPQPVLEVHQPQVRFRLLA
jgi:hypothetical protein